MKEKNWQEINCCEIRGCITEADRWEEGDDSFFMVETVLPKGEKTHLWCAVANDRFPNPEATFRPGDWVSLTGILQTYTEQGKMRAAWVEAMQAEKLPSGKRRGYLNRVKLRGKPTESGCLIDKGKVEAADLTLETEEPRYGDSFEVACTTVDDAAVQDFLDTLGCEEVTAEGALEICGEVGEELTCLIHTKKITPRRSNPCAKNQKRQCKKHSLF